MTRFKAFCHRWSTPYLRYGHVHRIIRPHFSVRRGKPPHLVERLDNIGWRALRYGGSGRMAPRVWAPK